MGLLLTGAGPGIQSTSFVVDAAEFNSTDYLTFTGNLTGLADGPAGTISTFINFVDKTGQQVLFITSAFRFYIEKAADDKIKISAVNTGGSLIWRGETSAVAQATWYHLLASWNLTGGTPSVHLYVNDASDLTSTTGPTAGTIDYTDVSLKNQVGANGSGNTRLKGALAEFWFDDTYLDISSEANRRKFITAAVKPVDLGADGSTPTGSAPVIYLHLDDGETANNFALNPGSGEDFTVNGALSTFASSPSD